MSVNVEERVSLRSLPRTFSPFLAPREEEEDALPPRE